MKQKTASVSEIAPFETKTISFEEIPDQSKLFLDFQNDSGNIIEFYPEKNTPLPEFAEKVLKKYEVDRNRLCDILLETNKALDGDIKTFINIEKLRQRDCVAVVTGQQAGLFSGPVYTIYKALSAIKFAEKLRDKNIKAVPVFWIAEEDHDFEEINTTFALNDNGRLTKVQNHPAHYKTDTPVGFVELEDSINRTLENFLGNIPKSKFDSRVEILLKDTYQKGETFATSFGKLLAGILKGHGLIFLLALNQELKQLCAPIFERSVKRTDELIPALLEKNRRLEEKNYHQQVLVEENSFPFFLQNEKKERIALRRNIENGNILVQQTKDEVEKDEVIEAARQHPQILSPNALLRPVVQDFLLPTITYFGGGAEIAYFAQNSAIYEILNRPVTPIRHRSSFTIIRGRNRRNLDKYNLNFTDLFEGEEKITSKIVEEFLSNDVAMTFADVEEAINKQLKRLEESLNQTEPTLADNAANRRQKIMWHIASLRKKYHRAEILKDEVAQRRLNTMFTELLPNNSLQERTLNGLNFINLYGVNFIEWLYEAVDSEEKGHQLLIF